MKTSLVINDLEQKMYTDPSLQRSIKLAKFSRNNPELFITADNFDNIHLWMNENPIVQRKFETEDQMAITCLQFDMNDKQIFSANKKGLISVWDIESQKVANTIQAHSNLIKVIINYNEKTILSGSADKKISLIDIRQKQKIAELQGHHLQINDLQLTDNKLILASASNDGTVKIWDLRQSSTLTTFSEHQSPVTMLSLLQDKQMLVSGEEDNMIICWDINQLVQYSEDLVQCSVQKLICDPQQSIFFSISSDFITAWNMKLQMLGQYTSKNNQVFDATIAKQITILSQSQLTKFRKTRIEFPQYLIQEKSSKTINDLEQSQQQFQSEAQRSNNNISNTTPSKFQDLNSLDNRPKTTSGYITQPLNLQTEDDLFKLQNFSNLNQQDFGFLPKRVVTNPELISKQEEEEEEILDTKNFCLSMPFKQKFNIENPINNLENQNNQQEEVDLQSRQQNTENPFNFGSYSQKQIQENQELLSGEAQESDANQFSKCFYPKIKIVEVEQSNEVEEDRDIISTQQFSLRFSQILFNSNNREYYQQIEIIDEIQIDHFKYTKIMSEKVSVLEPIVNNWSSKNYQKAINLILEQKYYNFRQTNLTILLDSFKLISDRLRFNNIKEDNFPQLLEKAGFLLESQYSNYQIISIQLIQIIYNAIYEVQKILSTKKQQLKRPNTSPQQGKKTLNEKIVQEFEKIIHQSNLKNLVTDKDEKVSGQAKQLYNQMSQFLNKLQI